METLAVHKPLFVLGNDKQGIVDLSKPAVGGRVDRNVAAVLRNYHGRRAASVEVDGVICAVRYHERGTAREDRAVGYRFLPSVNDGEYDRSVLADTRKRSRVSALCTFCYDRPVRHMNMRSTDGGTELSLVFLVVVCTSAYEAAVVGVSAPRSAARGGDHVSFLYAKPLRAVIA